MSGSLSLLNLPTMMRLRPSVVLMPVGASKTPVPWPRTRAMSDVWSPGGPFSDTAAMSSFPSWSKSPTAVCDGREPAVAAVYLASGGPNTAGRGVADAAHGIATMPATTAQRTRRVTPLSMTRPPGGGNGG